MENGNELFTLYKEYENGGRIFLMEGLDESKSDYYPILGIANAMASEGNEVSIPRPIHYKDILYKEVFGGLTGTRYFRKCPDLIVNGKYYEYEGYSGVWSKRKLANMIHKGLEQSDCIIIDNNNGTTHSNIKKAIMNRLRQNASICEVWAYENEDVIRIK